MFIGNAGYNCSCYVRYESTNIWLAVGVSIGSSLLLIILIIVIVRAVIVCRRRRNNNKPTEEREERIARPAIPLARPRIIERNNYVGGRRPVDVFELDDRNYWTIPADAAEAPPKDSVYCRARADEPDQNKEYAGLGEPQPRPQSAPEPASENSPYYLSLIYHR